MSDPQIPTESSGEQQSLLITGCSSGIGYDAAIAMAARGWRVFASCRQQADVERLRADGLESLVLDHDDPQSIQQAVDTVLESTGGSLDAVFVNGAHGTPGRVEDLPRDALRAIFETNVFGPFELINALLPSMRAANNGKGQGRILLCSSVLGFAAMPWRGAYNATKFAMEGLADTLRLELAQTGIDVVLIQPGPIATKIRQNSIPHFERWINLDAVLDRKAYETKLIPRLYEPGETKDRFELPPTAVTETVIHALESPRPKIHYRITTPTKFAAVMKRVLTTRLMDRVLLGKP